MDAMELKDLKGVGPRRLELLQQVHITNLEELLEYTPCGYLDYSQLSLAGDLQDGEQACVEVTLTGKPSFYSKKGLTVITVYGKDAKGKRLALRWFNQPYRASQLMEGQRWFAAGKAKRGDRGAVALMNPTLSREPAGIRPVYATPKGLPGKLLAQWVQEALELVPLPEDLPWKLVEKNGLMPRRDMVETLHLPKSREMLEQALTRRTFEGGLYYFLYMESCRELGQRSAGEPMACPGLREAFLNSRPFALTGAQQRVLKEVERDMAGPLAMNRLIQGDVGSGKTVVALFALCLCAKCGYQGVFLAPTELLARQQYETLKQDFGARCGLLTGSLSPKERREALQQIASGTWLAVAGTHALFSEDVCFRNLGLMVADEQHRFGVEQRARMMEKGYRPHVLVMSATPIPRTLALMLYGDLDLSAVDEMPPGRTPVKTHLVSKAKREGLVQYLGKEAALDHRSYVVCPLIEATEGYEGLSAEETCEEFQKALPNVPVGLLHGRMGEEEKQRVMDAFRKGDIKILVSTTVIEVGIHVPEALHMAIMGAERFGLSSLHQLRGRVGRGTGQAHCFLLATKTGAGSMSRLQAMLETTDGFEIANRDMALRGAGDLLGIRQSGESSLDAFLQEGSLVLMERARQAAREVMDTPTEENNRLLELAQEKYGGPRKIAMN